MEKPKYDKTPRSSSSVFTTTRCADSARDCPRSTPDSPAYESPGPTRAPGRAGPAPGEGPSPAPGESQDPAAGGSPGPAAGARPGAAAAGWRGPTAAGQLRPAAPRWPAPAGAGRPGPTATNGADNADDSINDEGHWTAEGTVKHSDNINKLQHKIQMFRNRRKTAQNRNLTVIKRSTNICQALHLPKILNLNPRSAMNKTEQITRFIEEEEIDVALISESHDRENKRLEDHIKLNSHIVISNLYQRSTNEKGGRPAIIANTDKYNVENLTNTTINIPWGVEVTWALLTPKIVTKDSVVNKIMLGVIYVKPGSKKKTATIDHIAQ